MRYKFSISVSGAESILSEISVNDIKYLEIESKSLELAELNVINESKRSELVQRDKYKAEFIQLCKDITNKRKEFIQQNISDKKIKVKINPFRNQTNFELQIRQIINKE